VTPPGSTRAHFIAGLPPFRPAFFLLPFPAYTNETKVTAGRAF